MLQSIHHRYGQTIQATDGEIGHVKDFYFDDAPARVISSAIRFAHVSAGCGPRGRNRISRCRRLNH